MSKVLHRMGRSAALHPLRTLALWVVLAALVLGAKGSMGGELSDNFTIPGAESQQALDLLKDRFPSESHASGDLVFHVAQGRVTDPGPAATIAAALSSLQAAPHVTAVSNPFDAAQSTVSDDGRTAFASITYDEDLVTTEMFAHTEAIANEARLAGVDAELTSSLVAEEGGPEGSEMVGLLVAVLVLFVAFGSVIAMGIPIGTALFGILIGMAGVSVLAGFTDVPSVSPMLAMMIGLGVGIDYALFVVTRHRQNLRAGMSVVDATLVRMVLVPATMSLLGSANWWLPGWLDRILPVLDLEGGAMEPALIDLDFDFDHNADDEPERRDAARVPVNA